MAPTLALMLALLLTAGALGASMVVAAEPIRPSLQLAASYRPGIELADYWVSEKYDGIRAYWNGHELVTRNGNRISAPQWFTEHWPGVPLDGELWTGRGEFERVSATVRDAIADEASWRRVRYMVFDLPAAGGSFTQRLHSLRALIDPSRAGTLQVVPQWRVSDTAELQRELEAIVAAGGEGLMLHRADAPYRAARSDHLLKLKPYEDAEARVIGHSPGRGKYQGMLGALLVERPDGVRFSIGTGFTDEQRRHPPAVGSWITYGFHGLTQRGVPRFARFIRVRTEPFEPASSE